MGLLEDVYQMSAVIKFVREGDAFTLLAPGVASRTVKPDASTPEAIEIGDIEGFEYDFGGGQDLEVWKPSPGHLELADIREIKAKLTLKFTSGMFGPLATEVHFRTSQKLDNASAQFNPNTAGLRKGWLYVQHYDAVNDALRVSFNLWGRLKITGGVKSEETSIIKPTWEFVKLQSDLNTGGLA